LSREARIAVRVFLFSSLLDIEFPPNQQDIRDTVQYNRHRDNSDCDYSEQ